MEPLTDAVGHQPKHALFLSAKVMPGRHFEPLLTRISRICVAGAVDGFKIRNSLYLSVRFGESGCFCNSDLE